MPCLLESRRAAVFFHEMHDSVTGMLEVRSGLTPENRPTCPQCAVLLDQALENAEVAP
jgi:hypothetical protein